MDLSRLLAPRSIAILGATERPSISRCILDSLVNLDFKGAVYPVNPKYSRVLGLDCFASLRALPSPPDVVALCVQPSLALLREVAGTGAGALVVYGSHISEESVAEETAAAFCREAGLLLCGPNCMGALNLHQKSSTYYGTLQNLASVSGSVGWISQSGSIAGSLLGDTRRFGFSTAISSGNELLLDTAAYIEHLIDDPETKIIATFTESVRDAERYVAALDRAYRAGKPVVVLKAGRSRRARQAVATHTGGIAGEARVFSALLQEHKAIEVEDLDTMTEVLSVLHGKHLPRGKRIGVVTDSGGKAELILDLTDNGPVELPPLPPDGQALAHSVIGQITGDGNPLDAWGRGDWARNLPMAVDLIASQACYDVVAYCVDARDGQPFGDRRTLEEDCELFAAAAAACGKPAYLLNARAGHMSTAQVKVLRKYGLAQLSGIKQGLAAVSAVARYMAPLPRRRPALAPPQAALDLLGQGGRCLNEYDAKQVLKAIGIPVVQEQRVHSLDQAKAAAASLGYPVVLKAIPDGFPHKTEFGLVALDLAREAALEEAWHRLEGNLRALACPSDPSFVVQRYIPKGSEFFLGVLLDPQFGPMLALGTGGLDIEVDPDFSMRPLPLRIGQAEEMLDEVRGARQLEASRGRAAGDRRALLDCAYLLADFAAACGPRIRALDINPIKVLPQGEGCVVVDALIVT